MRPVSVSVGPLATASANKIALSQTPTASFTLNGAAASGGVATLDTPRRVLFTFGGDESAKTMTITGTTWGGNAATDVVTGTATTAQSAIDFLTITSITVSSTLSAAATVGTNTVASSAWVRLDDWAPAPTNAFCVASGTVNYSVEVTADDPNSPYYTLAPYQATWLPCPDANLQSATASTNGSIQIPAAWIRCTLNSGSGSVTMRVTQFSAVPY